MPGIKVWPRGAVASSVICYSLGLTDVDPLRYGLHSARFVNEEPPRFQFIGGFKECTFDTWGLYKDANQAQNVSLICLAVGV